MTKELQYVKHDSIDKAKWDDCIKEASNGIVFAYSWFLDAVFDNWDCIILNDYEAVFPITQRSKFGLSYFFNPIFALQLGVFSKVELTKRITAQFIQAIPKKLKLVDIALNFGNKVDNQSFEITDRKCQFIDLTNQYNEISKTYSTNLKRNLAKGKKHQLEIRASDQSANISKLFKENRGESLKEMQEEQYQRLDVLLNEMKNRNLSEMYECWHEDELIAAACFSKTNGRILYVKGGSSPKGRQLGAMHFIMNYVIELHANSNLIFDFGGSSIEQVARFNHSFGAKDYLYQRLYRNNLPFFVKLLKK